MPNKSPITVSHADLDAALEVRDAAASEAAEETVGEEQEPETPETETEQAISSDPDQDAEPEPDVEAEPEVAEEPEPDVEAEPEVAEEPEPDIPAEPDDHKERSRMGRRMSELEGNINLLVNKIDQLVTAKTEPEADPDDDEPVFMTKKQLRDFVKSEARNEVVQTKAEEQAAQSEYENAYVAQVHKAGADLSPKQLDAVFKEMFDNHNEIHHKIPQVDADINFHRAVASLTAKVKPAAKVIPLKKDDPKNLGGPADTNIESKKVAPQKLDKHAAAFAKHHNLSDEKIAAALTGETRPSLKGKFEK